MAEILEKSAPWYNGNAKLQWREVFRTCAWADFLYINIRYVTYADFLYINIRYVTYADFLYINIRYVTY